MIANREFLLAGFLVFTFKNECRRSVKVVRDERQGDCPLRFNFYNITELYNFGIDRKQNAFP